MSTQPPETGGAVVPTCFRHPDREAYIRCTRCERPICPDCMRDAPVGHQCVECVAEGRRTVRQARTAFGGRPIAAARVTMTLIGINVVVYLLQVFGGDQFTARFMMWSAGVAELGEWWRLITGAFLHQQWGIIPLHLLVNMYALYMLGQLLEERLGHVRFAILYLLSALGGNVAVYLFGEAAIGASGAIYGLFAALFIIARRQGYSIQPFIPLIVINLAINLIPFISWQGHLGGLVVGAAVSAAFAYAPRENRGAIQFGASAAMLAGLLLIVAAVNPIAPLPGLLALVGVSF